MDGQPQYDLSKLSVDQLEELEEDMEDQKEEDMENQFDVTSDLQEGYGSPIPDEKHNAHAFLNKAAFIAEDTVRTTFLKEEELGRPIFTVRFMMDMEDVSHYYLDSVLRSLKLNPTEWNGISNYFKAKIQNVTHSGMSNKGFAMNLNVTQKKDMTRKRIRPPQDINKGGKK